MSPSLKKKNVWTRATFDVCKTRHESSNEEERRWWESDPPDILCWLGVIWRSRDAPQFVVCCCRWSWHSLMWRRKLAQIYGFQRTQGPHHSCRAVQRTLQRVQGHYRCLIVPQVEMVGPEMLTHVSKSCKFDVCVFKLCIRMYTNTLFSPPSFLSLSPSLFLKRTQTHSHIII